MPGSLDALVERLEAFRAAGFSKFVLRPAAPGPLDARDLEALAAAVLPLQTT